MMWFKILILVSFTKVFIRLFEFFLNEITKASSRILFLKRHFIEGTVFIKLYLSFSNFIVH